jgi:hypothetical protein
MSEQPDVEQFWPFAGKQEKCERCGHVLGMHKFPNGDNGGRCYNLLDGATDAQCDCPGFAHGAVLVALRRLTEATREGLAAGLVDADKPNSWAKRLEDAYVEAKRVLEPYKI